MCNCSCKSFISWDEYRGSYTSNRWVQTSLVVPNFQRWRRGGSSSRQGVPHIFTLLLLFLHWPCSFEGHDEYLLRGVDELPRLFWKFGKTLFVLTSHHHIAGCHKWFQNWSIQQKFLVDRQLFGPIIRFMSSDAWNSTGSFWPWMFLWMCSSQRSPV